jgi:hypothetical protein
MPTAIYTGCHTLPDDQKELLASREHAIGFISGDMPIATCEARSPIARATEARSVGDTGPLLTNTQQEEHRAKKLVFVMP